MKNNLSIIIAKLLLSIYPFLLVIDSMNGYMIRNYEISLNIYFKSFFLLLIILVIFRGSRNVFLILIGFFSILFIVLFYHSLNNYSNGIREFMQDIYFMVKTSLPILTFLFTYTIYKKFPNLMTESKIIFIFTSSIIIISINVIMGILGIGYSQYVINDIKVGGIGFFKSGNELSGIWVLSVAVLANYIYNIKRKKLLYIFFSILVLVIAFLTASKASILGTFLVVSIIPYLKSYKGKFTKSILFIPFIFISFAVLFTVFENQLRERIDKLLYFYETYGFLFMLTTGRSFFTEIALQIFYNEFSLGNFLFGISYSYYTYLFGKFYDTEKIAEVDILDIFLCYGLVYTLFIFLFWLFIIYRSWRNRKKHNWYKLLALINIILLLMSITPGHILWSGMLGPFVGIVQIIGDVAYAKIKNTSNK